MAEHGLANRGFLADEALEGILPERRDQLDGLLLIVLLDVDRHLVKQADLVRVRADVDDLRRFDHALEIVDAAVVAVFLAFGRFIFEILAQIAEFPRGFYVLDQLRAQLDAPVFQLFLHLLNVNRRQFVVHKNATFS